MNDYNSRPAEIKIPGYHLTYASGLFLAVNQGIGRVESFLSVGQNSARVLAFAPKWDLAADLHDGRRIRRGSCNIRSTISASPSFSAPGRAF